MNKKALAITCGQKTFGVKWLFGHPATHQLLLSVHTNAARFPNRFIQQNRCKSFKFNLLNQDCKLYMWMT